MLREKLKVPKYFGKALGMASITVVKAVYTTTKGERYAVYGNALLDPELQKTLWDFCWILRYKTRANHRLDGGTVFGELKKKINFYLEDKGYGVVLDDRDMCYLWFTSLKFLFGEDALKPTWGNNISSLYWVKIREDWLKKLGE